MTLLLAAALTNRQWLAVAAVVLLLALLAIDKLVAPRLGRYLERRRLPSLRYICDRCMKDRGLCRCTWGRR